MTYTCVFDRFSNKTDLMVQLKSMLKTIGWTVLSSSDGTTYNSSGDQITQSGTGAGGMNNTNAWFRIRCPNMGGVTREICAQRVATEVSWRLKYSYSAGFTGGTPGATRVPSATDEQVFLGSGTDASPTGTALMSNNACKYGMFIVGDIDEGYSFFSHLGELDGNNVSIFWFDKINASSSSSADVDGYVLYTRSVSINNSDSTYLVSGWYRKGLSGEAFLPWAQTTYGGTLAGNDAQGQIGCASSNLNQETIYPMGYVRHRTAYGTQNGLKGFSNMIMLKSSNRGPYSTLHINSNHDKIILGNYVLPWNGQLPKYP